MDNALLALLVVGLGVTFLGSTPAAGQAAPSLAERLMAMEHDAMEQWRTGNPMRWAEISAPEVTYVDPGLTKPVVGIEAYTRYLEAIRGKVSYQGSEFLAPSVVPVGDLAVLTYNYRSTSTNEDGTVKDRSLWNTTEVYGRFGEGWKIVHTHWSYVGHTAPESVEVPVPVAASPAPVGGVLGELMALESAAMERWRKGDPQGFVEISDDEVTYFDSGTPRRLDSLAALGAEYARRAGTIRYDVMEFLEPSVQVHGDAAVLFYRFFSTRLRADGSVERRTPWNCTEVYARRDGRWRIVHTHWSLIGGRRPGAAPGADEEQ